MTPILRILVVAAAALPIMAAGSAWADGVTMAAYGGGNGETWRKGLVQQFTTATGTAAKVVDVPDTEAALRASAAKPQYNVAWVTAFSAANLFRDGLLQTFDAKDFPELNGLPEKDLLRAPDGRLVGIPVQFQYYSIAFNTSQAKASDFASWHNLADPAWKGRIAVPQAYIAASYDVPMLAHLAGKDADSAAGLLPYKAILANAFTTLTSFAQGNLLLSRGEVAALPFYSARIAALKHDGAPVDIVLPKEGGLLLPYYLVVPKGAADVPAATAWLKQPPSRTRNCACTTSPATCRSIRKLPCRRKSGTTLVKTCRFCAPSCMSRIGGPFPLMKRRWPRRSSRCRPRSTERAAVAASGRGPARGVAAGLRGRADRAAGVLLDRRRRRVRGVFCPARLRAAAAANLVAGRGDFSDLHAGRVSDRLFHCPDPAAA